MGCPKGSTALAQLYEILARQRTLLGVQVNDKVTLACLQQNCHFLLAALAVTVDVHRGKCKMRKP